MKFFRPGRVFILLAVLAAVAFAPMVRNFFLSDSLDWVSIGAHAHFPDYFLTNYAGVRGPGSYRPLITLVMSFFYHTFGLHPEGYHVASIVLHMLSSFAVYILALMVLPRLRARAGIATIASVLFLLVPTHSEVVYWVAGYPDLFATFFSVWSLVFFLCYRRYHARTWLLFACLFWVGALLSKENAIVLPGIAFAMDLYLFHAHGRTRWDLWRKEVYPWFIGAAVFAAGYLVIRYYALGGGMLAYSVSVAQAHVPDMIETALHMALTPFLFDHVWRLIAVAAAKTHLVVAAAVSVIALGLIIGCARRYRILVLLALVCFGIAAIPMLPLSFDQSSAEGERFAYFPSVFALLLFAVLVVQLLRSRVIIMVASVVLIAYAGVFLVVRHHAWRAASTYVLSLRDAFPQHPTPRMEVLGLPEMMDDIAPVLRNGFPQLVALYYPMVTSTVDRIPVFTRVSSNPASQPPGFEPNPTSNGFLLSPLGTDRVYGSATYQSLFLATELWGYDYAGQFGRHIKIILRPGTPAYEAVERGETGVYWVQQRWLTRIIPFPPSGDNSSISAPVLPFYTN